MSATKTRPVGAAAQTRCFDRLRVHSYTARHSRFVPDADAVGARPLVLVWLRGGGVLRHLRGSLEAPTGALCFLRNEGEVELSDVGPGGAVLLELPTELTVRGRERIASALGRPIIADCGAPAFLRSFVETLDRQPPGFGTAPGTDQPGWVQTCVCDITERVLAECAATSPTTAQRLLLDAKDYAISHLTDLDLTPARVAFELSVSLRTLNRLFAEDGETVCGWIRRHRLERCREDLVDSGKQERGVGQIGAMWGFLDAAHFSRVFKEAYGCSPREWRAAGRRADRVA